MKKARREFRAFLGHRPNAGAGEMQQHYIAVGHDVRACARLIQERHLADHRAKTQPRQQGRTTVFRALDADLTFGDHPQRTAQLSLAQNDLIGVVLPQLRVVQHRLPVVARKAVQRTADDDPAQGIGAPRIQQDRRAMRMTHSTIPPAIARSRARGSSTRPAGETIGEPDADVTTRRPSDSGR
ncbi:MAG: hypothetical protein O3C09_00450 [Proteobacteria bacterium]|nr:hypothetical protein [Pseudomonadota bacterium]